MEKKTINRKVTFALIQKKDPKITFESINDKADYYWEDICDRPDINILPIYEEVTEKK